MLLRGRWLAGHVLVAVMATIFVLLGFWQLGRQHEVDSERAAEREARAAPAPDVSTVEPVSGQDVRAEARGTFDGRHEFLLRNQLRGGDDGYNVLTPLVLDDGTTLVVDRGWVPRAVVDRGDADTHVPDGPVVVRGLVREGRTMEPDETVETRGGLPALTRVDLARIEEAAGVQVAPVWIVMQSQEPEPGAGAPELPEIPSFTQVNHFSYVLQWWALALIPLIGWPIVLVRHRRAERRKQQPRQSVAVG